MIDDPIDFRSIDPTQPVDAFDRRVAQIRFAASGVMARRRAGGVLFVQLIRWRAPLLAALLLVTLVSIALLRTVRVESGLDAYASSPSFAASDEVAEVLGATSPMGELLMSTSASSTDALLDGGVTQ